MKRTNERASTVIGARFALRAVALAAMMLGAGTVSAAAASTMEDVCGLSTTLSCWDFETTASACQTNNPASCFGDETDLYYKNQQGSFAMTNANDPDGYLRSLTHGTDNGFAQSAQQLGNVTMYQSEPGSQVFYYPKLVSSTAEGGARSMQFTMPSGAGPQGSGDFIGVFKRIPTTGGDPDPYRFARFGWGGEFWVRWAERDDTALLTNVLHVNGDTFGGVKRLIVHGANSSPGSQGPQFVTLDAYQRRLPQAYSASGTQDLGIQNNVGCTSAQGPSYPEPPCVRYRKDQWMVFQLHVIVASNAAKDNGLFELFVDDSTTPIVRSTNVWQAQLNQGSPPFATQVPYEENAKWDPTGNVEGGFGKFSFTLFSTNAISEPRTPAHMWVDNVVISKTRVPPISSTAANPDTPRAPGNLSVQ